MQRTSKQNRAMHKYFSLIANTLNDAGLDMRATLKPEIDIPWSTETVKEYLWRPVQKIQTNKQSTTELTTKEVNEIQETLQRFLGQRHGISQDFPSVEEIMIYEPD